MTAAVIITTIGLGAVDIVKHNWALVSIVVTLVMLVSLPLMILRKYVRIIVNIFTDAPVPLGIDTRDYDRIESAPVEFRAFDGHRLCGSFIPGNPDRPLRGTIIFAHELDSNRHSAARYCQGLIDAGYEIFTFDFRCQGDSTVEPGYTSRLWPSDREQADVLGAIAYVGDWLERQSRPRDIGLAGVSRGAGAAILAGVGVPGVKAIMIDGGFSTDAYLEYLMQRWVSIFAKVRLVYQNHPPFFWRFLRWLAIRDAGRKLKCSFPSVRKAVSRLGSTALFIIHGERDGHIPVAQAKLLHALANGPKYIWICPGAKHNQSVASQARLYHDYSVRFFDRHLSTLPPGASLDECKLLSDLVQPLPPPGRFVYSHYTRPQRNRR